ncbi:MAG: hypothetical protein AAB766_03740, partial [Patescibacteria group bacterium]
MKFQRREKDFTMNVRLISYLREQGWTDGKLKKLNEFSENSGISLRTLQSAISKAKTIGPEFQARLYNFTKDTRFQPRDALEQTALDQWIKNPTPRKTVVGHGDRALAESPHTENTHFFYECMIELLKKYRIGQSGGPQMLTVTNQAKLHKSVLYGMQNRNVTITVGIKAKLFLSFTDPAFAPLNDNEKRQTELWREQIPRPLSFVKGVSTELPPKPTDEKKEEKIVPARLTPLEQG